MNIIIWIILISLSIIGLQYEKIVELKAEIKKLERQTASFYAEARRRAYGVRFYYHKLKDLYAKSVEKCNPKIFIDEYIDNIGDDVIYSLMLDKKLNENEFVCEEILPRVKISLTSGDHHDSAGGLNSTGQSLYALWKELSQIKYKDKNTLIEKTKEIDNEIANAPKKKKELQNALLRYQ